MEALFWISAVVIAYVYVGYPAILAVWAGVATRRGAAVPASRVDANGRGGPVTFAAGRRAIPRYLSRLSNGRQSNDALPGVSIVIAARNEAARLPARIENLLASDYPRHLCQIIVVSDGSTDDTAEALTAYRDVLQLIEIPCSGKATALNTAVAHAYHPILVFADARQRFAPDAIRRLVSHFADSRIGAVSGELVLDCEDASLAQASNGSTIADGVGTYWKYEKWLRRREATVGSTLGVTGAIYAMRRWLWQPLPPDTLLDDVLGPMRVVLRGYRVTFDAHARAFDDAAKDAASELRRKVRTLAGNFQLLAHEPRLMVPLVNPVWIQFVSHKLGRLLVPYALVAIYISSAVLAADAWWYAAAWGAQTGFYGLAVYGALLDRRGQTATLPRSEVFREAA